MSYSIWLEYPSNPCAACGHDRGGERVLWDWDCTSNLAPCWCAAGADLATYADRPVRECAPSLREALAKIEADPAGYAERFDPANGWGSVRELIPRLRVLLEAFEENPDALVRVWR